MNPEDFAKALQEALGDRLKSVLLYGSAAAGDFVPGISGYDVLLLVQPLGPEELSAMAPAIVEWTEAGNPTPELLTPQELVRSGDVFPIELTDMQQSRRVLCGDDPLASLKVDMPHYRTQLERELKIKLLLLRRKYVAVAGDAEQVGSLMLASVSTFLVLLRAALRLYNEAAPADKLQALDQLEQRLSLDLSALRRVAQAKADGLPAAADATDDLFAQYLQAIQAVIAAVDSHLHPAT